MRMRTTLGLVGFAARSVVSACAQRVRRMSSDFIVVLSFSSSCPLARRMASHRASHRIVSRENDSLRFAPRAVFEIIEENLHHLPSVAAGEKAEAVECSAFGLASFFQR